MNHISKKDIEVIIKLINKEIASKPRDITQLQKLLNKLKLIKETL